MGQRRCPTILVGQCSLVREGLFRILCTVASKFRIVASAPSVSDLGWEQIEQNQPHLLIIAGSDPQVMAQQIEAFKERQPAGRVAVLADQNALSIPWALTAFQAGANAYFLKVVAPDTLIKALELVVLGETIFPPEFLSYVCGATCAIKAPVDVRSPEMHSDQLLPADPVDPNLSAREEEILRYIGEGYPNKIIARKLGIMEGTVKVHVKAILRKVRVGNRTQAAIWFTRL